MFIKCFCAKLASMCHSEMLTRYKIRYQIKKSGFHPSGNRHTITIPLRNTRSFNLFVMTNAHINFTAVYLHFKSITSKLSA